MFSLLRFRRLCGSVAVLLIGTWLTSCPASNAASSDPASIREAQLRFVTNLCDRDPVEGRWEGLRNLSPGVPCLRHPENKSFFDQEIAGLMHNLPSAVTR